MAVKTYTKTGNKAAAEVKLPKTIFGIEVKSHDLLKQAYLAYQSNGRVNLSKTKTRGEVRGGGKKPWRQKGTGRARFGSIRVPIWRGGGITFGPTGNESYSKDLPLKSKRLALKQALSLAAKADKVNVLESFDSNGKTAETAKLLSKIGAGKNSLLVVDLKDKVISRATNNISTVKVVQANYLNVYDVLNAGTIFITEKSIKMVNDWLTNTKTLEKKEDKK